ncbi:Protein MRPS-6 [Aphelenchoides avenae]|nr:Protein MRPS-6 [Aphelenchus avenae]
MPHFEVTLITRNLGKNDLFTALKRAVTVFLDHGAVVRKLESGGHRDLPHRRIAKQTKEHVYTSNYFMIDTWMPLQKLQDARKILQNDLDFVHVASVSDHELSQPPKECNLEELLKPPTERAAVKELRDNQKIGHFTRQMIYKRTQKEWRAIPKSYTIAPPRN